MTSLDFRGRSLWQKPAPIAQCESWSSSILGGVGIKLRCRWRTALRRTNCARCFGLGQARSADVLCGHRDQVDQRGHQLTRRSVAVNAQIEG